MIDLRIGKRMRAGSRIFLLDVAIQTTSRRVVVLGPSGAGKTLLLKSVAGLLRPDAGHVRMDGVTLFDDRTRIDVPARARRVAYMFQDYALFPHLDVRQNIAFGLRRGWLGPGRRERIPEVEQWIGRFGLTEVAHLYPDQLSGGQRQRTALARALITEPRMLLLDEPFAALDAPIRVQLRQELDALQNRLGIPMMLITHDPEDAAVFGDTIVRMRDGQVDSGTVGSELVDPHGHAPTGSPARQMPPAVADSGSSVVVRPK